MTGDTILEILIILTPAFPPAVILSVLITLIVMSTRRLR